MNKNYPKFLCPVCSQPASYETLVVDTYFMSVLQNTSKDSDDIEVNPNGTWFISDKKPTKRKAPSNTTDQPNSKKPVVVIDLEDSAVLASLPPLPTVVIKKERASATPKRQLNLVDLTLD